LGLLVASAGIQAKTMVWQPAAGHAQVAMWPGVAPNLKPMPGAETVTINSKQLIVGKPVTAVISVLVGGDDRGLDAGIFTSIQGLASG
jgi:hypothetical protein